MTATDGGGAARFCHFYGDVTWTPTQTSLWHGRTMLLSTAAPPSDGELREVFDVVGGWDSAVGRRFVRFAASVARKVGARLSDSQLLACARYYFL